MLKREYKYYLDHKAALVKRHKGKFIVIQDDGVIGVYDSRGEALQEAVKTNELGTFLIQEISGRESDTIQRFTSRVYV